MDHDRPWCTEEFDVAAGRNSPMAYWLFKEEPNYYSLADLCRDERTKFANFALVRISRSSVMPATKKPWAEIERLSKQDS